MSGIELSKKWQGILLAALLTATGCGTALAANAPAFDFETVLESYFDESSGLISFGDYTVGFAPEPPFDGLVAVVNQAGEVMGQFPFFPDYQNREGVFARVRAQGPADVSLTEPGIYTVVFLVSGQPATRLPVKLIETSSGDDPFAPQKTYAFDGYWRTMAHFTTVSYKGEPVPELTFWAGSLDMAPDAFQEGFVASLLKDGQEIAHSKRRQGSMRRGHFSRARTQLYHPHSEKGEANARVLTLAELLLDGSYEIQVHRNSDGRQIRSFDFDVESGMIVPLARTQLGFQPASDYVMPRVLKRGASGLEMVEATWIEDRR